MIPVCHTPANHATKNHTGTAGAPLIAYFEAVTELSLCTSQKIKFVQILL